MMKLSQVLKDIAHISQDIDCPVKGLAYDSRQVKEGYLFVAIKGFKQDGHLFLNQAKSQGACTAVVENIDSSIDLPQVKVVNTRLVLAEAAANFYNHPTADLNLIGVTGTNGKTTITYILESIFKAAGQKTGIVGTIDCRVGDKSYPISRTTPESVDLQKLFAEMRETSVKTAVMEVSSHACELHRIDGCRFNQTIFTNLTQDHFDFHKNFEDYFAAKRRLFEINDKALHVINLDNKYGQALAGLGKNIKTYSLSKDADFRAGEIVIGDLSSRFNIYFGGRTYEFELMLGGLFNIYNTLAAVTSAVSAGVEPEVIQHGLFNLKAVPGRFEIVRAKNKGFKIIIDYAHTPDGLENLLKAARQITAGKLITVFGCGGERDKGKRPKMGKIASSFSDMAIVTSDNPRSEDPDTIMAEITRGNDWFATEADRKEAIQAALSMAGEQDTVVIAGKGHETTQEINGEHLPFSDREVVKEILE